jgi:hypothetical protein
MMRLDEIYRLDIWFGGLEKIQYNFKYPLYFKAWHRLATTYYNLVMSERQFQQTTIPQSASAALLSGVTETGGPSATQHSATMAGAYSTSLSQAIPPISPVQQSPIRSHQLITNYAVNAVRCLFKAIQLAEGSALKKLIVYLIKN